MAKLLIVDDDKNICQLLALYLEKEGHQLTFAYDGSAALDMFHQSQPDLIILDQMLPLISGLEVCKLLRKETQLPIIMLTAVGECLAKVTALDAGADDYIVKPFEPMEVAARVRAQLRKHIVAETIVSDALTVGALTVSLTRFEVKYGQQSIEMTPKEVQLLYYFLQNIDLVLTREQILEKVWDFDYLGGTRTIDMHVRNLRSKLPPSEDYHIRTVVGVGYKLERRC